MHDDTLTTIATRAGLAAGPVGIASLVLIIAAEASGAMASMADPLPVAAGLLGVAATCALLLGLVGLHLSAGGRMEGRGGGAMAVALIGAALVVGAAWSTAVVAPAFDAAFPGLLEEPLTPIVAGYVLSHAFLGIGVLVWGVIARRTGAVSRGVGTVLIVGGLLCITPLPARYLVVAIGVGLASRRRLRESSALAASNT